MVIVVILCRDNLITGNSDFIKYQTIKRISCRDFLQWGFMPAGNPLTIAISYHIHYIIFATFRKSFLFS